MTLELTVPQHGIVAEAAWPLVQEAASAAADLERAGRAQVFAFDELGRLQPVIRTDPAAALAWHPGAGWESLLTADDPRASLVGLYLPICSATRVRPITVGHLGQSLDGFIATHSGDSQFVTGEDNLVHMHRLRALCDAVVVGAGTVAADNPRLTTRRVAGPNPLRVILDPERRLESSARVFVDKAAATLYLCGRSRIGPGERRVGAAEIVGLQSEDAGVAAGEAMAVLRARGCSRVFVEGGGVTVSAFLAAGLLDCLQITLAPVLIGNGRPAIRLPAPERLRDCRRPAYRVFRMGGDVLFDCDLREEATGALTTAPAVTRIL